MSRVVHFDIAAEEPERLIEFYSKVFGWQIRKWEGPMEYWLVSTGSADRPGIDGGISPYSQEGPKLVQTIDVASVDEATAQIEAHGGKIVKGKSAVPGVGWLAYCADVEGNLFGIMQADPQAA